MAETPPRIFLHSFRSDGSISSICRQCQVTIGSRPNEIDLRKLEEVHVCSDFNLRELFHPERVADAKN